MTKRRRKKTNPKKNRSGLGAFLGSAIGTTPGAVLRSFPLSLAGSIAGGATGGYLGAKKDRKARGGIGGAIGGAFGPIGAAIGGYVAGKKPDAKKKNPAGTTIALAIGAGVVAVGTGYTLYRVTKGGKALKPGAKDLTPEQALQGVIGNSTLEEAAFMVADVQQPILLQTPKDPLPVDDEFDRVDQIRIKIVRPSGETTIEEPAGIVLGTATDTLNDNEIVLIQADGDLERYYPPEKSIAYLITGLSPESAQLAYELATVHFADNGVDWTNMAARDTATQQILSAVAPKVDWTQGLKPHTYGSAAWKAWSGVQLVGTIAWQSYFNKRALQGPTTNPVSTIQPDDLFMITTSEAFPQRGPAGRLT